MGLSTRLLLVSCGGLLLAGCGAAPASVPGRPIYQYTCCQKADIDQAWKPGESFGLHWISQLAPSSSTSQARYVVLSAQLAGPYSDVASLKKGGGPARSLKAADITADSWQPQQLVSTIPLPGDLPAGLYDLRFKVAVSGGSMGGASVIRVGGSAP